MQEGGIKFNMDFLGVFNPPYVFFNPKRIAFY